MLAALSIDLDGIEHYHRIHALSPPAAGDGVDPIYEKATERFGELCARLGILGTAFCIGANLGREGTAKAIGRLARAGHELANHTLSHDYALSRRPSTEIAAEIRGGADAIERVAGSRPVGFRAPGYTQSPAIIRALVADGYRYDSSAFPALPYYAAKAAVMGALALSGRPSSAILDRPRVLFAPRVPYRPASEEPYARGTLPIIELPVTTGLLGFPLIGTSVTTLPGWALRISRMGTNRLPLFNLELHGIDLLDGSDASPELAARQRDLRVPAAVKISRIESFVRSLENREWLTLARAADRSSTC